MQYLRLITALLLGVIVLGGVTGCSDSDDSSGDPLVGTWRAQTVNGQPLDDGISMRVTFNKNGTFTGATNVGRATDEYTGVWSTADGILTTVSDGVTESVPYSINGNTLTMRHQGAVFVLTR